MNMEEFMQQWSKEPLPYIAILRGIHPEQAEKYYLSVAFVIWKSP